MSTESTGMSRRDLLRRGTAAGVAVGGVGYGSLRLDHGPVQNSQAIAPVVAAGAIGGSIAVGWALREFEILGADAPVNGLTPDALLLKISDTVRARASNNASTMVDNRNIVDGIKNSAWADGKLAAIDQLNNQATEQEVTDAATSAVLDYEQTVVSNQLKSWNESLRELNNLHLAVDDHPDFAVSDVFDVGHLDSYAEANVLTQKSYEITPGNQMDVWHYDFSNYNGETGSFYLQEVSGDPFDGYSVSSGQNTNDPIPAIRVYTDGSPEPDNPNFQYLNLEEWHGLVSDTRAAFQEVKDGIGLWVDKIYADVQAGDLDTSELLTPREQAELTSDDEDFPQALADLEALNVSVDYEREAEIYLSEIGATLYGRLGYTGDTTLSTGTYDPDTDLNGTVYLTYDVSEGSGEWDSFETGVDGGTVTFSSEPFEETEYMIQTVAGETATVVADDLSENDTGDAWTVDISDQVEDSITEIEAVDFYATTSETSYETIQLRDPFEIVTFTDSEGEEYEESSFEKSEPQDDSNYITEEEWKEQQERHDELIEKYEESQQTTVPGVEDVLSGEANGLIGIAVVGFVLVSAILSALNPLS